MLIIRAANPCLSISPTSLTPENIPRADGLLLGVDVSHWQGRVDWASAAASGRCEFAYAKATEGVSGVDRSFADNWAGTLAAGVPRGAYHFMVADCSAGLQAEHFLRTYPGDGELPPVLDLEWGAGGRRPSAASAIEWLRVVWEGLGVRPVVYTSPAFAAQELVGPEGVEIARDHGLWVAHYGVESPTLPMHWSDWRIWQRGTGTVPGVRGRVDVNVMKPPT